MSDTIYKAIDIATNYAYTNFSNNDFYKILSEINLIAGFDATYNFVWKKDYISYEDMKALLFKLNEKNEKQKKNGVCLRILT